MNALIIDETTIKQMTDVLLFAKKNILSMDDLLDMKNGIIPVMGDTVGYFCYIPVGYKIVFSIENQPAGLVRHISISCNFQFPHVAAVKEIMKIFEFENELEKCITDIEQLENNGKAINVLELITTPV